MRIVPAANYRARALGTGQENARPLLLKEVARMSDVVTLITNLISNLGFPIACVCVLFYMQVKEREEHKAESEKWVEAINKNTLILEKLLTKLDLEGDTER